MVNRPKALGTAAETAVVRYLRDHGFPNAERRALAGSHDMGDVVGTIGVCWEIKAGQAAKNASDGLVQLWLEETDRERVYARADIGVLVLQRGGIGALNAGRWWALLPLPACHDFAPPPPIYARLHLADACTWLRWHGYGERMDGAA